MRFKSQYIIVSVVLGMLIGCNGGNSSSSSKTTAPIPHVVPFDIDTGYKTYASKVVLSGRVTYDRVPPNNVYQGLDYKRIKSEPAKWVAVQAVDENGNVLQSTATDTTGHYSLDVPSSTNMRVRVFAWMYRSGKPSWDVKVVDNTNGDALYVMQGALRSTDTHNSIRDLHADSGWTKSARDYGYGYKSERVAAPFAILDSIQHAMHKVRLADGNASFPSLQVNWSVKNVPGGDNLALGQIGTSHYANRTLFILGKEDVDTDEYDDHIIAHEWGHYYEDTFSRSDSPGGSHGPGEYLDIRLAFSEGWGNAFSGMALDNPFYFDTGGSRQGGGFFINVEKDTQPNNPGWFSEASIQRILYDLYDKDANDTDKDGVNLGFAPIHEVMTHAEKESKAFTSLFSFVTAMNSTYPNERSGIDTLLDDEEIAPIKDIWGSGRTNHAYELPYRTLSLNTPVSQISFNYTNRKRDNELGHHLFYRFTITTEGSYTITLRGTTETDPDFYLYGMNGTSFGLLSVGTNKGPIERKTVGLNVGSYVLDINDYASMSDGSFTLSVSK